MENRNTFDDYGLNPDCDAFKELLSDNAFVKAAAREYIDKCLSDNPVEFVKKYIPENSAVFVVDCSGVATIISKRNEGDAVQINENLITFTEKDNRGIQTIIFNPLAIGEYIKYFMYSNDFEKYGLIAELERGKYQLISEHL